MILKSYRVLKKVQVSYQLEHIFNFININDGLSCVFWLSRSFVQTPDTVASDNLPSKVVAAAVVHTLMDSLGHSPDAIAAALAALGYSPEAVASSANPNTVAATFQVIIFLYYSLKYQLMWSSSSWILVFYAL